MVRSLCEIVECINNQAFENVPRASGAVSRIDSMIDRNRSKLQVSSIKLAIFCWLDIDLTLVSRARGLCL